MPNNWQTGPRPAGPYVAGSVDGRLRELEAQVEWLTDVVDTLRSIIRTEPGGDVRIKARRSLRLEAPPAHIEIRGTTVTVKGMKWPGKNIAD